MIEIAAVKAMELAIETLGRIGVSSLQKRAREPADRRNAYRRLVTTCMRTRFRLQLVQRVHAVRTHPLALMTHATALPMHAELLDRFNEDLLDVMTAWEEVREVGTEAVQDRADALFRALAALAIPGASSLAGPLKRRRIERKRAAAAKQFDLTLTDFLHAARDDLGNDELPRVGE
ncbi:hypothetical protein [Ornithinimicrobium sediminis]|uniref:hypothetical protein n=1 Tax=Ornithinimicrobium sediminis TaxID=2904603 RepID=UPI001E63D9AA|nr:hypothetical protein [Ornithinimicrobium sediminis]MCE0485871.1 hypothetical protein [Ornithinimicrobium sediminis]